MNTFVADPEWSWWIIGYFFLGGIAAGAYFNSAIIDLFGRPEDRPLARIGYLIAVPLILVCAVFLTLDLHQPTRFWHMLFKSEVVHDAVAKGWPSSSDGWKEMASAPIIKYWSPMSVGSWALSLFGLCSGLSFLGSLRAGGFLEYVFRRSLFGKLVSAVGCFVGFFVASYTGALLTATNQPIWSDSVWIAPLFLASAASTGISAMLLIARCLGISAGPIERLARVDQWAILLELGFFLIFLGSLGAFILPMLWVRNGLVFVFGTLFVAIVIPLLLHGRAAATGGRGLAAAAFFALVGGFLMRYGILTTPPALLERPEAVAARFGPEDGRPRGGGSGADPGNRGAAKVEPLSKITGTR
jgi:formate-dependent nitrite reductase membrane component NrfD